MGRGGEGVLSYMGDIGIGDIGPKGYAFIRNLVLSTELMM